MHAEVFNTGRPLVMSRDRLRWPPFSSWLLLLLVLAKPLSDALYEVEVVKYLYMLLLGCGALLCRYGYVVQHVTPDSRNKALIGYLFLLACYFYYLFGLALVYGGSLSGIFKIVSPFVFFVLLVFSAERWILYALAAGALLTIVVNAALLPFDFGWVQWGSVRTFKGFYFFKTDLAYALIFSLLIVALYLRNRITPMLALLILLAAVQIVLANSRLNYVTFVCVLVFLAIKQGLSVASIVRYGLLVGLIAAVVVAVVDPGQLLGFDTSDSRAFTQGRTDIWASLLMGMRNFSPVEWLFGLGYFGDSRLVAAFNFGSQDVHNAHNEILHLISTQGIVGLVVYCSLWVWMYRMCRSSDVPAWARGTAAVGSLLFLLQGMTTVMSPFATKTWPLVMVFLAMRGISVRGGTRSQETSAL